MASAHSGRVSRAEAPRAQALMRKRRSHHVLLLSRRPHAVSAAPQRAGVGGAPRGATVQSCGSLEPPEHATRPVSESGVWRTSPCGRRHSPGPASVAASRASCPRAPASIGWPFIRVLPRPFPLLLSKVKAQTSRTPCVPRPPCHRRPGPRRLADQRRAAAPSRTRS